MGVLSQYVVVIVLGICLCLGYIIKHSISFIPNKYIPLIMAVTGTVLNVWINNWQFSPEILLGGLASGLASTGAFELVRNISGNSVEPVINVINKNTVSKSISDSKKEINRENKENTKEDVKKNVKGKVLQ